MFSQPETKKRKTPSLTLLPMNLLLYRSMEHGRTRPVSQGTCGIRQRMEKSLQNGKRILFFSFSTFCFLRLISTLVYLLLSPTDIDALFMLFLLQIPSRTIIQIRTHAQKYFQKLEKQKQKEFAHRERWNAMRTQTIQSHGRGPNTLTPPPPVPGRCGPSMLFPEKNQSRGMHMMEMMRQDRGMERDQMVARLVASMRWPLPQVAV